MTDTDASKPEDLEGQAPTDPATQPDETPESQELDAEALKKELEKTRREAAQYRRRLREREEADAKAAEDKRQAQLTAEQRAKEAEERATKAEAEAAAKVQAAERKLALAGTVTNPDRVLRLMDDADRFFPDGKLDTELLLSEFPEYKPASAASTPPVIPNARTTQAKDPSKMTDDEWFEHKASKKE